MDIVGPFIVKRLGLGLDLGWGTGIGDGNRELGIGNGKWGNGKMEKWKNVNGKMENRE